MKICVVSTSDSKGGAAVIAQRLVRGLRKRQYDVTFLVRQQDGEQSESTSIACPQQNSLYHKLRSRIEHRRGLNAIGSIHQFPKFNNSVDWSDFDIVHFHDINRLNLNHLPWLAQQTKLIWTIHSMSPFTGNCVFSFDCDRWKSTCGECPQFGKWPLKWLHRDASDQVLARKKNIYRKTAMTLIGVSEWLSARVRESVMGALPTNTIQNALDETKFKPVEKILAKKKMGIEAGAKTIAFSVASNPEDTRKGIDIILDAIPRLRHEITFLPMAIGANTDELAKVIGSQNRMMQPVHLATVEQLRDYYSAADLVWHPSRADTSSLVSMEAMACGTPVVAAEVGGVPEVVGRDSPYSTGVLIPPDDPEALARETDLLFDSPDLLAKMSVNSRRRVESLFGLDRFLDQHLETYESALTG